MPISNPAWSTERDRGRRAHHAATWQLPATQWKPCRQQDGLDGWTGGDRRSPSLSASPAGPWEGICAAGLGGLNRAVPASRRKEARVPTKGVSMTKAQASPGGRAAGPCMHGLCWLGPREPRCHFDYLNPRVRPSGAARAQMQAARLLIVLLPPGLCCPGRGGRMDRRTGGRTGGQRMEVLRYRPELPARPQPLPLLTRLLPGRLDVPH